MGKATRNTSPPRIFALDIVMAQNSVAQCVVRRLG
jgi:hypothetical protein